MSNFEVVMDQQNGSSYEIGWNQGNSIQRLIIHNLDSIANKNIDVNEAENIFDHFAPHLTDEIRGLSDSLNIPYKKGFSLFSGYDIPKLKGMGCSSVVTPRYYVRNYDFTPDIYDHRFAIVKPKEAFGSVGYSLHIVGRHEGVNEKGLAAGFHFVNHTYSRKGLSAASIIRIVLDTCKTTDEAVRLIKELPHAWSYNYSIGDSNGHTAIVEVSPIEIRVRYKQKVVLCTNHFQHDEMSKYNRTSENSSSDRLYHLERASPEERTGQEMFDWFRDPESPMFYNDYDNLFGTLHTFAYLFEEQKVLTAIANGKVLELAMKNLDKYRKGKFEMKGFVSTTFFKNRAH